MAITFNTNLAALGAQRNIGIASNAASSSLSKLSSGSRVPQAKDDAAGLAIGSKLKSEVTGLTQASNNAAQAISLLQIADGALSTMGDILQRMKALAVQSSSGQLDDSSRALLQQEFGGLQSEIDRVASLTNFNGTTLLAGTASVSADINNLAGGTATTGKNLIGQGVNSIRFGSSFDAGAVSLAYNANGNLLTMTNLVTGQSDTVDIGTTAISAGQTQTVNFNGLGATVVLNDTFNKSVSTNIVNGYRSIAYSVTDSNNHTSNERISAFRLKDSAGITAADFNGATVTILAAGTAGNASTIAISAVNGHTFSIKQTDGTNGGTVNYSSATGAQTVTLTDGLGNEIDYSFTIDSAFSTNGHSSANVLTIVGLNTAALDLNADDLGATAAVTTGTITGTTTIDNISFAGTGSLKVSDLVGKVITFASVGATSTATSAAIVDSSGVSHTFHIKNGATSDLTSLTLHNTTFEDDQGNEFRLNYTVGTTFGGGGGALAFTITGDHVAPTIQNNSVKVLGVSKGSASTFNFGDLDSASVTWSTGTASTSTASLTLNGQTFTSGNVDLTTAGLKTVTLTNGSGTSATSITYQFNLTGVLDDSDTFTQVLGELGQVVGANTITGGTTTFDFKVGTGTTTNDSISFSIGSATGNALGIDTASIATKTNADNAIGAVNAAITAVASRRADIGAAQSRLDFASNSISVAIENTTAAASALLDVDVSAEITKFTNQNVLMQAGISLLGQANQQPALLLRLLQ